MTREQNFEMDPKSGDTDEKAVEAINEHPQVQYEENKGDHRKENQREHRKKDWR